MSETFLIPVIDDRPPSLVFPNRCVACGAPRETESTLLMARLVMRGGRQVPITLRYQVPHCQRCAGATKAVFLAGLIPFLLGFAAAGIVAFLYVVMWASPLDDATSNTTPSLVLGGAAAMTAGLAAGFVFEIVARVVLWPFFGRALMEAPLLVRSFFDDSDHVAGLTGRPNRDASQMWLTFRNDGVATEFAGLNARVLAGAPRA